MSLEPEKGRSYWINNKQKAVILKCLIYTYAQNSELTKAEDYIAQDSIAKFDPHYFKKETENDVE